MGSTVISHPPVEVGVSKVIIPVHALPFYEETTLEFHDCPHCTRSYASEKAKNEHILEKHSKDQSGSSDSGSIQSLTKSNEIPPESTTTTTSKSGRIRQPRKLFSEERQDSPQSVNDHPKNKASPNSQSHKAEAVNQNGRAKAVKVKIKSAKKIVGLSVILRQEKEDSDATNSNPSKSSITTRKTIRTEINKKMGRSEQHLENTAKQNLEKNTGKQNLDKNTGKQNLEKNTGKHNPGTRSSNGEKVFHCEHCPYTTTKKERLQNHLRSHSTERLFKCPHCEAAFKTPSNRYNHVQGIHPTEKPHKCSMCDQSFAVAWRLKTHERRHLKNGLKKVHETKDEGHVKKVTMFQCPFCDFASSVRHQVVVHRRVHLTERPFKCRFCPKDFSRKEKRTDHERTHTGEKPYKCNYCPKTFARSTYRKNHEWSHSGEKRYKCSHCSKAFRQKNNLKRHQTLHHENSELSVMSPVKNPVRTTIRKKVIDSQQPKMVSFIGEKGQQLYQCQFCPYNNSRRYAVTSHERTHTGEKPYKCPLCPKWFAQTTYVKMHVLTHTGERPYSCSYCPKRYRYKSNKLRHELKHAKQRGRGKRKLDNSQQNMTALPVGNFDVISRNSEAKDDAREEEGPTSAEEGELERSAEDTKIGIKCRFCPYAGAYQRVKRHERSHTGEKPFKCAFCSKAFTQKSSCQRHEKIHMRDGSLSCPVCSQVFRSDRLLEAHARIFHKDVIKIDQDRSKIKIELADTSEIKREGQIKVEGQIKMEGEIKTDEYLNLEVAPDFQAYAYRLCQECRFVCESDHGLALHYSDCHQLPRVQLWRRNFPIFLADVVNLPE